MKFWCASANSSKQRKSLNKKTIESNNSFSSSVSYASISSIPIPKSDSGYSEASSTIYSSLEQILIFEKTYHKNLKEFIIKYSRPLRRFLNPEQIVELFQNIEKICAISESIVRQCEKFLDEDNHSNASISSIYQSWFGLMIDSYNTYIARSIKALAVLKQCENQISYFLQMPVEFLTREISEFILLPIRHICILNDLFQSLRIQYSDMDWKIMQNVRLLSQQAINILQSLWNDLDLTLQSEVPPIIVLQRTDKESWQSKRLELSDSRLMFTQINRTSSICLSNVLRINEDFANTELHLIVASSSSKNSRYSSIKMKHVYIRFEDKNAYISWLEYLTNAIQEAKDQNWSKTNELVI